MLVLTRKPGEQIVIGNNIRITVVGVGPGRVKIGIEAPENVRVDRSEVHDRILRETDVLESIGEVLGVDSTSTMVASGDTSLTLHNRIAETLTEPAHVVESAVLPRKSR